MAKTLRFTGTQNDVPLTLHDNGDGTYSLQVAVVSDTSGVGGTTTNVVLLDGGATGTNSDAADVTGASGTSIFARLRGLLQLLAGVKALLPVALGGHGGFVVEGVASGTPVPTSATVQSGGLLGTPADAVTGWPDQTQSPVSTTAAIGQLSKDVGALFLATGDDDTVFASLLTTLRDAVSIGLSGAAHFHTKQVSVATAGGPLLVPRATSRSIRLRNPDTTNPVYFTDNTAPSVINGYLLKAGESIVISTKQVIYAIATGAAVTVAIYEEYD